MENCPLEVLLCNALMERLLELFQTESELTLFHSLKKLMEFLKVPLVSSMKKALEMKSAQITWIKL